MYKLELSNFNQKIYLLNSMSADQEADNNRYVHQDLIQLKLLQGLEFPSAIEYNSFVCKF